MDNYKLITLHYWTYLHHRYSYSIAEYWPRGNYKYDLEIKLDDKVVKRITSNEEKWVRVYVKWFIDSLFIRLNNVAIWKEK